MELLRLSSGLCIFDDALNDYDHDNNLRVSNGKGARESFANGRQSDTQMGG